MARKPKREKKKRFSLSRLLLAGFLHLMKNTVIRTVFIVLMVVMSIYAMMSMGLEEMQSGGSTPPPSSSATEPETEAEAAEPVAPKYKTVIDWAALESYGCAVEVDDYNGDIIAAGTWTAEEIDAVGFAKNSVPIVWDIYVSDTEYSNLRQLKDDEYVCSVGGFKSEGQVWEFDVEAGQYLYVKYTNMAGTPVGILHLEKK